MEDEDKDEMEAPFPQANDFEKVISLIKIKKESLLQDNEYLTNLLNVSLRQVNYYLAACVFLGIINKERLFTEYGCILRNQGHDQFLASISMKIISLPVFGDAFFSKFFYGEDMENEDISELLSINYDIKNAAVADRRASTVRNWINWIFSKRNALF